MPEPAGKNFLFFGIVIQTAVRTRVTDQIFQQTLVTTAWQSLACISEMQITLPDPAMQLTPAASVQLCHSLAEGHTFSDYRSLEVK